MGGYYPAAVPMAFPVGVAGGGMQLSMGLSMSGDAAGIMVPLLVRAAQRLFGSAEDGRLNELARIILGDPALARLLPGLLGGGAGLTEKAITDFVLRLMDNKEIQDKLKDIVKPKVMQRAPSAKPDAELARLRTELLHMAKDLKQGLPQDKGTAIVQTTDPREQLRQLANEFREGKQTAPAAPKVQADPRAQLQQMLAEMKAAEADKKSTISATVAGNK